METPQLYPWQDPQATPLIYIHGVSKKFGSVQALDTVSLSIYRKEFFSLLGPSGCGKTTLLRLLGGFEKPSNGRIFINNQDVTEFPPYKLPVNMMFQSYALFPHMTVEENVSFGLRQDKMSKSVIKERVHEMLDLVHMTDYAKRLPHQLSGGQQQRVALARSLAKQPQVLLLDEPLGALDKTLREKTQFELMNIQEKVGITFVMVTHDQEEAMTMSSRIAVMNQGRILQVGTPGEVYEYPNCLSVAKFVGSINIFEGIVLEEESEYVVVHCSDMEKDLAVSYSASVPVGAQVSVVVRPEKIMITHLPPKTTHNTAHGIVRDIAYLGDVSVYHIQLDSGKMVLATQPNLVRLAERPVTWESEVFLRWRPESSVILTV